MSCINAINDFLPFCSFYTNVYIINFIRRDGENRRFHAPNDEDYFVLTDVLRSIWSRFFHAVFCPDAGCDRLTSAVGSQADEPHPLRAPIEHAVAIGGAIRDMLAAR